MFASFLISPLSCWSHSFWFSRRCTAHLVAVSGRTEVTSVLNGNLYSRGATTTTTLSASRNQNTNSHQKNRQGVQEPHLSSKRGRDAPTYLPSYLRDARNVEMYHPTLRLNGAIQLSVAENYMMEDRLLPAFHDREHILTTSFFTSDSIYYQPTQGREDFRRILCSVTLPYILQFHRTTTNQRVLNPNNLIVGAGCNAVLENLCLCLASWGEGVMIPTPYYAAFEFDLTCRIGLKIIPVHPCPSLKDEFSSSSPSLESYYPTFHSLERAYTSAQKSGVTPRILLLSHPNNPLGIIYPKSVLEETLQWCLSRDIHLISDEIYAGSVYSPPSAQPGTTPYAGTTFHSILDILPTESTYKDWNSRVHWIYALSKDFCLSGLRVGMCYTENEEILYPMQKLNDLCQVSSITQSILMKLLDSSNNSSTDDSFLVSFLTESRRRLQARSLKVQLFLNTLHIPTLPSEAGMFLWMDLQEFLPPPSLTNNNDDEEREHVLYKELVQSGLLFTPGISMKMQLPGFFRCVYTAAKSDDEIDLALHRLKLFVDKKRSSSK